MPEPALYRAEVTHARAGAVRHRLRHSVFYLFLELGRLEETSQRLRLFSYNRFNLLSFFDRDHGARDGGRIGGWIEEQLRHAGLWDPEGRIFLLTLPRILGYVFNPLSVYYCFDRDDRLVAVLHEVRNTFGELHGYLIPAQADAAGVIRQQAAKRFHVSPFIDMAGQYRFRLTIPGDALSLGIRETTAAGIGLTACLRGRRHPLTDGQLARALLAMPLMTFKVMAAIHLHALGLWLKGARFHRKPPPPRDSVSVGAMPAAGPSQRGD